MIAAMVIYAIMVILSLTLIFVQTRNKKPEAILHIDFKDENDQYIKLEFLEDFDTICNKNHINVLIDVKNKE